MRFFINLRYCLYIQILNNINISSDLILKEFLDNKNVELKNEIINIKNRVNIISNDEIKVSLSIPTGKDVAPYAGAWIEITVQKP